jgi:EAL and modified HD-GYP domain-containing signal transduction protein
MLDALIQRLFGRKAEPPAPPPPAAAATPVGAGTGDRRSAGPPPQELLGVGARRPLVSPGGGLAGFEFYAGSSARHRLRRAEDAPISRASTANVLGAMRLCASQGLIALAEVPAPWLALVEDDSMFVAGMHFVLSTGLPSDARGAAPLLDRLRGLGARVGWRATTEPGESPLPGRPDFLLLPPPTQPGPDAWQRVCESVSSRSPGVPQVLLDLADVEQMEALLHPPVMLAACAVKAGAAPARVQALPPQTHRLLQLTNRLLRDEDNALLVADIKADAALALRLLQYLNSAGATPGRQLDSIEQAVMVLGRDALYRWVAQMLVRQSPPRKSAQALQAMALARARLLELLARSAGEPNPGALYLLGLASMLPLLLECSADEALAALQLPAPALMALQQRAGPWQPYLALAEALERQDLAAAAALAEPFKGLEVVMAHSAQAWLQS